MPNIFESLKNQCFGTVSQIMGYDAAWTDSVTEIEHTARVRFKIPTAGEEFAGVVYEPQRPYMEFLLPDFEALKPAVDAGRNEKVSIEGKGEFWVRQVHKKYDGDWMRAIITDVNDIL